VPSSILPKADVQTYLSPSMPRIACIVNPAGRDGASLKRWRKAEPALEAAGFDAEVHHTERIGHASEIAFSLKGRDDLEMIVACGGDGTVHEVASGMRGSRIPLGIIPGGTGNDVARAHGYPMKGVDGVVSILTSGIDRHVGALRLQGVPAAREGSYPEPQNNPEWDGPADIEGRVVRWVFLESDCGVTSATARAKLTRGKWIRGSIKYTYLGMTEIFPWKKKTAWVKVNEEEGEVVDLSMLCFSMSEMFGGGYKVAPNASPIVDHGHLCTAWGLSKFQMLNLMGPLKKGKHVGKWGIELRPCTRLEIRAVDADGNPTDASHTPSLIVQADGEPCMQTPALLEFHPKQLWIRGSPDVPWDTR
jgi:diacylglycerol kinase family enzyme